MLQRLFSGLGWGKEAAALARLASLELLLKEKDARLEEKESAMIYFLKEKDARLQEKDTFARFREAAFAKDMELLQYALDTAESRFEARALLEAILCNLWNLPLQSPFVGRIDIQTASTRPTPKVALQIDKWKPI